MSSISPTGGAGGGGNVDLSSSASSAGKSQSGDAMGSSATGSKQFFFGGNPNAQKATGAIESTLANPFVLLAVVAVAWLIKRKR